ncbi:CopM family metallochaperone [Roseixanthobacter glucoisosaccharinicivorans]|uniref:CopM family metallochaperone n=1 Tax=Roseixanthobacter glucoisosaccharinicivorans TaxID=3119923 RepID=UPI00372D2A96
MPGHDQMPMSMPAAGGQTMSMPAPSANATPATTALQAANARMHADMAIAYTGDADVDFVRGMIAHHQGAIDMAKVELSYGTDPQIRKLAEGIIAAQEQEIAEMRKWLAAKGR